MGSSNPALEVSVSFGRFENDSLSWEKWSTFSPNKYLEEVEKCATPGSVAQKKAYFEEHYKKIAARKAELLTQEKHDEGGPVRKSNGHERDKQEINLLSEVNEGDELDQEPETATKCQDSWFEELKQRINSMVENEEKTVENPEFNKAEETALEEAFLVKKEMETPSKESPDVMELSQRSENVVERTPEIKDKNFKLDQSAKSHKIRAVNKERNDSRTRVRLLQRLPYTDIVKMYRGDKLLISGVHLVISAVTIRVLSECFPIKSAIPPAVHSGFGCTEFGATVLTSGDGPPTAAITHIEANSFLRQWFLPRHVHISNNKDIVKRAFKTFQSNYNQLKPSTQEQSAAAKTVPVKGRESRVPTFTTPQKENGGINWFVTVLVVSSMEKKNAKAAPSYSGLKSDEEPRKKAFSKKPETKSNDREAARRYLQSKSKDNRDAEIKKLRQNLNFKATPLPGLVTVRWCRLRHVSGNLA
ncbi:putative Formin-like protein 8 [Hibiscus syriacus]|uniref:Formin-like protein 8 n=1 Tax=Hibiscus syriacus TaxID=106335 RepID=A0A6A3BHL6_HIBSY|nr:putative Formin-like protein 8 [Hibiscus syriacus]